MVYRCTNYINNICSIIYRLYFIINVNVILWFNCYYYIIYIYTNTYLIIYMVSTTITTNTIIRLYIIHGLLSILILGILLQHIILLHTLSTTSIH